MHRSHSFTTPHAAGQLPPFGAAGWLMVIQTGAVHRRDDRSGSGEMFDRSQCVDFEPAPPIDEAWDWKHAFAPALDWLRRVLELRIRRA